MKEGAIIDFGGMQLYLELELCWNVSSSTGTSGSAEGVVVVLLVLVGVALVELIFIYPRCLESASSDTNG